MQERRGKRREEGSGEEEMRKYEERIVEEGR